MMENVIRANLLTNGKSRVLQQGTNAPTLGRHAQMGTFIKLVAPKHHPSVC